MNKLAIIGLCVLFSYFSLKESVNTSPKFKEVVDGSFDEGFAGKWSTYYRPGDNGRNETPPYSQISIINQEKLKNLISKY